MFTKNVVMARTKTNTQNNTKTHKTRRRNRYSEIFLCVIRFQLEFIMNCVCNIVLFFDICFSIKGFSIYWPVHVVF